MLWYILLVTLTALAYWNYRRRIKRLLEIDEMFPGPASFPLVGNLWQLALHRHDLVGYATDLFWFYRRSIRFWLFDRAIILIQEPHYVEKILGNTNNMVKSDFYDSLLDWIGRGLLVSYGNKWKKSRKILTPGFHFSILENFLDIFEKNGLILIDKLGEKTGQNVDIYPLMKLCALDNICEAAMGTKVNAQMEPNGEYVTSIKKMCEIAFTRNLSPWYWPDCIFKWSVLGHKQKKALGIIHGLTNRIIAQRKQELSNTEEKPVDKEKSDVGIKERKVFLDILLQSSEEGGLTDAEIREEVDTFMFEGHDTVTSGLSFTLYCLAENPECQQKAFEEIQIILGDDDRAPTLHDLQEMKYLENCIKEALRLYPSVPLFGRNIDEDVVLDERAKLPKGCQAIVAVLALHQNILAWTKPFDFYPEHFELDEIARRHPYQYLPFSAGPRNCIGQRFAMLEMKSTICKILQNFQLFPANPAVPIKHNIDLILVSDTGVHIRLEKRTLNTDGNQV